MPTKAGPLTREELQAVWSGAVDRSYREPLIEAGEGGGFEAWTQLFAQLERASKAIDVTTQAMYILPWSGQTNPPAAGEAFSEVDLSIERSRLLNEPLYLEAGKIFVVEETTDFGPGKGVTVRTGRRYVLAESLYFPPGTKGPFVVRALAEFAGYGFDNPLPGTLRAFDQPGSVFDNDLATVTVDNPLPSIGGNKTAATIVAANQPDMFLPEHEGQYVVMTSGANVGKIARITTFLPPLPPLAGSSAILDPIFSVGLSPASGTFQAGEYVEIKNGGTIVGYALALDDRTVSGVRFLGLRLLTGTLATAIVVGRTFLGLESGATGTAWSIASSGAFVPEAPVAGVGGGAWRILDWFGDWGLSVTNALSPSGGRAGWLDELGAERNVNRSPAEGDESYRARVATPADVVSPNAIKRTLNRALGPISWCFREVGTPGLRGIFFDGTDEPPSLVPGRGQNDAYDEDAIYFTGLAGWSFDGSWAWDMGPAFFNGYDGEFGSVGSLAFQEPMVLEEGDLFWAKGFFGRMLPAAPGLATLAMIWRGGRLPASVAGFRLRGLYSGGIFEPSSFVDHRQTARRYRVWLDYARFRGYFLITVARLGGGEFGMAYDAPPAQKWGYDLPSPFWAAFDGYPVSAADLYRAAWNAVDAARAGGVLFEFAQDDGACP